ncbi:hypothetical protein G7Y89_g4201 [Cudoniella acicularis]|uniref:Uncharacterized protein n=1 Tax=Cudoniella acicularis TaxID=354080 RepID=A0A8H4W7P1_9HELO|nr:hypothetical protein G7Y89_g4201 [Cudoniella acicularis]
MDSQGHHSKTAIFASQNHKDESNTRLIKDSLDPEPNQDELKNSSRTISIIPPLLTPSHSRTYALIQIARILIFILNFIPVFIPVLGAPDAILPLLPIAMFTMSITFIPLGFMIADLPQQKQLLKYDPQRASLTPAVGDKWVAVRVEDPETEEEKWMLEAERVVKLAPSGRMAVLAWDVYCGVVLAVGIVLGAVFGKNGGVQVGGYRGQGGVALAFFSPKVANNFLAMLLQKVVTMWLDFGRGWWRGSCVSALELWTDQQANHIKRIHHNEEILLSAKGKERSTSKKNPEFSFKQRHYKADIELLPPKNCDSEYPAIHSTTKKRSNTIATRQNYSPAKQNLFFLVSSNLQYLRKYEIFSRHTLCQIGINIGGMAAEGMKEMPNI